MSETVGSLVYDLDINDKNLGKQLDSADKSVAKLGDHVESMGEQMQAGFRTAAKALTVVSAGLTLFSKNATDFTVQFVKDSKSLAREIGVSTTEASRLTAAFGRMGIEADSARQMFGIFSKQIVAATADQEKNSLAQEKLRIDIEQTKQAIAATTKEIQTHGDKTGELGLKLRELNNQLATQQSELNKTTNAFQKLGISTVDASGKQKDFNTILFEVADKFQTMPDGVDKTALSMELFGRQGKDMIKVLNLGSAGIQDLEKRADELGLTLNAKTIGAVNNLVQSQKALKEQTDAVKIAVGTATAPVLTAFNTKLNELIQTAMNTDGPLKGLATNILAFGGPVTGGAAALAGFLGNLSSINKEALVMIGRAGLIIGIIALLSFGIYEAYTHFASFQQAMANVGMSIMTILQPAITLIQAAFGILVTAVQAVWAAIQQNLQPAVMQLWDALQRAWAAVNPLFIDALKVLAVIIAGVLLAALWLIISVLNVVIQVFAMVVSAISNVINWISNLIKWAGNAGVAVARAVADMGRWFLGLPGTVAGVVNSVVNWFAGLPGRIVGAMAGVANAITSPFSSAFHAIINFWNSTVGRISFHIPDWVPGIGGKGFSMPRFAQGAVATGPTVGMFGEAGTEAVLPLKFLNRYTTLFDRIEKMANSPQSVSNSMRQGDTVINIGEVHDRSDADYLIRHVIDRNSQLNSMGLSQARSA